MVRFLLENGANPKIKDKTGRNALEIAQLLKKDAIVKILQEFDNKNVFRKFPDPFGNSNSIQTKSPFKFVENNYSDETIEKVHQLVHLLCPELRKQHGHLHYNKVRPYHSSPRMLLKLFVISCTPMS
jgi:hypothetical protein